MGREKILVIVLLGFIWFSCENPISQEMQLSDMSELSVIYDANGADVGIIPVDGNKYHSGDMAVALGNVGNLSRSGYEFLGWNTMECGGGIRLNIGDQFRVDSDLVLFAEWVGLTAYSIHVGLRSYGELVPLINGTIVVDVASALAGDVVTFQVVPNDGYELSAGTLRYRSGQQTWELDDFATEFLMPAADVDLSAGFRQIRYEITMGLIVGSQYGHLWFSDSMHVPGSTVEVSVYPGAGSQLKPGSLQYLVDGDAHTIDLINGTYRFIMPSSDVELIAEFEPTPDSPTNDLNQVFPDYSYEYRLPYGVYDEIPSSITGMWNWASPQNVYIRAFRHSSSISYASGTIRLSGITVQDILERRIEVFLKLPGQTGWLDLSVDYNFPDFDGLDGDGCWTYRSSQTGSDFRFTFGPNYSVLSEHMVIVKIVVPEGSTLWPNHVGFPDWMM